MGKVSFDEVLSKYSERFGGNEPTNNIVDDAQHNIDTTIELDEDAQQKKNENREWQQRMINEAVSRNIVVMSGTGTGKTFVAVRVLEQMTKRASIFIVPSIVLAIQQTQYLRANTAFEIVQLTGAVVDSWGDTKDEWRNCLHRKNEKIPNVLVLTGDILNQAIDKAYWDLSEFDLLVFDEMHHCGSMKKTESNHVYSQICRKIKEMDVHNQPRVLGLTASPIAYVKPEKQSSDALKTYLSTLLNDFCDAKLIGNGTRSSLNNIDCIEELYVGHAIDQESFMKRPELANMVPEHKRYILTVDTLFEELGRIGGLEVANRALEQLESEFPKKKDMYENKDKYKTKYGPSKDAARVLIRKRIDHDPALKDATYSDKVEKLVAVLEQHWVPQASSINVIIFCDRRECTVGLLRILSQCPSIKRVAKSPQYLVGQDDLTFSKTPAYWQAQLKLERKKASILTKFRSGACNLLICTSVGEEGIDIGKCGVVVLFSFPNNFCNFLQARGRARAEHATMIIMRDKTNEKQTPLKKWEALEEDITGVCIEGQQEPLRFRVDIDDNTQAQNKYVYKTVIDATLDLNNSIRLLNDFLQTSFARNGGEWWPNFSDSNDGDKFYCVLKIDVMPSLAGIKFTSGKCNNKKEARQVACWKACRKLHKQNNLNDHFSVVKTTTDLAKEIPAIVLPSLQIPDITTAADVDAKARDTRVSAVEYYYNEINDDSLALVQNKHNTVGVFVINGQQERYLDFHSTLLSLKLGKKRYNSSIRTKSPLMLCLLPCYVNSNSNDSMQFDYDIDISGIHRCNSSDANIVTTTYKAYGDYELVKNNDENTVYPSSAFPGNDFDTYKDYFKIKYNVLIDDQQALLKAVPLKKNEKADGNERECDLPPGFLLKWNMCSEYFTQSEDPIRMLRLAQVKCIASLAQRDLLPACKVELLMESLTRKSANLLISMERLEFLGDRVLHYFLSVGFYALLPNATEGIMTDLRKEAENNDRLARVGKYFEVEKYLTWQHDDDVYPVNFERDDVPENKLKSKGIADCVEALLGCVIASQWLSGQDEESIASSIYETLVSFMIVRREFCKPVLGHAAAVNKGIYNSYGNGQMEWDACYQFTSMKFLALACTVPGYTIPYKFPFADQKVDGNYQRLEFLGDAIIDIWVAMTLFRDPSKFHEGEMTIMKRAIVREESFAVVAMQCGLHKLIQHDRETLSKDIFLCVDLWQSWHISDNGECCRDNDHDDCKCAEHIEDFHPLPSQGQKVLCDVFEAFIGAIFIDGGEKCALNACETFLKARLHHVLQMHEMGVESDSVLECFTIFPRAFFMFQFSRHSTTDAIICRFGLRADKNGDEFAYWFEELEDPNNWGHGLLQRKVATMVLKTSRDYGITDIKKLFSKTKIRL